MAVQEVNPEAILITSSLKVAEIVRKVLERKYHACQFSVKSKSSVLHCVTVTSIYSDRKIGTTLFDIISSAAEVSRMTAELLLGEPD